MRLFLNFLKRRRPFLYLLRESTRYVQIDDCCNYVRIDICVHNFAEMNAILIGLMSHHHALRFLAALFAKFCHYKLFERLSFISGFTGSSGIGLVLQNKAHLYTDSRYYI